MLLELKDGSIDILINIDGNVISPYHFNKWIKFLKDNHCLKRSTLKRYSLALNKFIIWSLYNPKGIDESLLDYLVRYRSEFLLDCRDVVTTRKYDDGIILFEIEQVVLSNNTKSFNTINLEMGVIEKYFIYLRDIGATTESLLQDDIDWLFNKIKNEQSIHAGYGLSMRDSLLEIYGKKKSLLKPLKTKNHGNESKYFPFYFFYELLEISDPMERLIYLLCGGAGARVGQALSLTWFDIDYEAKEVYLIDPRSDMYSPLLESPRLSLLLNNYGIDPRIDKPHSDIAFKYPIPLEYGPLIFMTQYLENQLFRTMTYIVQPPEYDVKHPFVCTTSTGSRLSTVQVSRKFNTRLKQLKQKYPLNPDDDNYFHVKQLHNAKGIHSLRHMLAVSMAEIGLSVPEIGVDTARALTQNMLGHKNPTSTEVYFKLAGIAKRHYKSVMKEIEKKETSSLTQIIQYLSLRQTYKGHSKYERYS